MPGMTTQALASASVTGRSTDPLRTAGVVFAIALVVHGADHFRRGMDVLTGPVFWAGNLQIALSVVTLVLIFGRHRLAAPFAAVLGFASAIGFSAAHLLPHWSSFSDSFTGAHPAPHVTGFSWFAAAFEIGSGLYLGIAAVITMRRRRSA
jgi:hypothetical protein